MARYLRSIFRWTVCFLLTINVRFKLSGSFCVFCHLLRLLSLGRQVSLHPLWFLGRRDLPIYPGNIANLHLNPPSHPTYSGPGPGWYVNHWEDGSCRFHPLPQTVWQHHLWSPSHRCLPQHDCRDQGESHKRSQAGSQVPQVRSKSKSEKSQGVICQLCFCCLHYELENVFLVS